MILLVPVTLAAYFLKLYTRNVRVKIVVTYFVVYLIVFALLNLLPNFTPHITELLSLYNRLLKYVRVLTAG